VHIAFSKTDQEGKGTLICIQGNNTAACLVLLLQRFLLQGPNVTGALFCHANGKPITRYQFSAVLRKALISAGLALFKAAGNFLPPVISSAQVPLFYYH
jgi:hypothetical protein